MAVPLSPQTQSDIDPNQARIRSDSLLTRSKILRAAEALFAERGVHAVSFAEIQKASGQKNRSAIPYHFGTRIELIQVILERHSRPIHAYWGAQLDASEGREPNVRETLELLTRGVATKLDDPDGGPAYLRVASNLVHDPVFPLSTMRVAAAPAPRRIFDRLHALVPIPRVLVPIRNERLLSMLYGSLAVRAVRETQPNGTTVSREVFLADLLDCIERLVRTEPSQETLQALRVEQD